MVHDLQQYIVNIGMCFFDFIEQQNAVWLFGHGIGEQTALIKADITRWRTNQTRHRVPFHVLGHVEANQLNTEHECELFRELGFADACRAAE